MLLIIYQIFLANFTLIEGLESNSKESGEFKSYDTNNPDNAMILAQQNAGNIEVLKKQLDEMLGVNQQVQDLSAKVTNMQQQVDDLVQAQQDYANDLTGGEEPEITGV